MSYDTPTQSCPYCKTDMHADWVDNGIGMVQCGPYHCSSCGASEVGPERHDWIDEKLDTSNQFLLSLDAEPGMKPGHPFSDKELETGYYEPGSQKVSPYANTVDGELVDHRTAKQMYNIGLLDEKNI